MLGNFLEYTFLDISSGIETRINLDYFTWTNETIHVKLTSEIGEKISNEIVWYRNFNLMFDYHSY